MTRSHLLVFMQFLCIALLLVPYKVVYIPYSNYASFTCNAIALSLALWIFTHNRLGNFNIIPEIKEGCNLIKTGPYRYIRHPMYSAVTLFGLSTLSFFAWWKVGVLIVLIGVLYLKARREEFLWCNQSEEYKAYQEETKMFIPYIL